MKRLTALVLFLAAVAGLAYWVHTHHNGNLYAAWSQTAAAVRSLAGGQTREAANPNSAPTPAAGARQGRGRNPGEAPRVAVVTAVAESVDLPITRSSVGWVEPDATVTVRARIDGQVVEQKVRDGEVVKAGDVLFRIDDREIQAQIARDEAMLAKDQATLARTQADVRRVEELLSKGSASRQQFDVVTADSKVAAANVAADQATLARTQADVRRVEELLSKGSASRQQFDVVTADSKVAAANVAADQATLQADRIKLDYTVIKAPIAGRVGVVRVTPGNLVRANDTGDGLVTITQLKPLRISFSLPERELDLVRAALARNGAAPVRAYASGATQASATGKLFFVDSAVDTLSGTVTAKAIFDNEGDQLWPGQYVRIEVDLGARPNVTTVPLVAVSPGQGGTFAFVVKADGTVERRKVEIADSRNEIAVIASGIRPGEKVVIEGQARLSDGSPVVEKPAPGGPAAGGTDRTAQAQ
jgi:membrane fusion protein, multidrug efflux system